jgi:hypothetical protein
MLLIRGGITVRASAVHLDPAAAALSALYWARLAAATVRQST